MTLDAKIMAALQRQTDAIDAEGVELKALAQAIRDGASPDEIAAAIDARVDRISALSDSLAASPETPPPTEVELPVVPEVPPTP